MFSQNSLVKVSSAILSTFSHSCNVFEFVSSVSADGSSSFVETLVLENCSCRISFSTSDIARDTSVASGISQVVTLFLPCDVVVNSGSKLVVFHDGLTSVFENSGSALVFPTHQQVKLRSFSEWT